LGFGIVERLMPQDATILDFFFLMSGFFAGYAYEKRLRTDNPKLGQAIAERATRLFPLIALGTALGLISFYLRPETLISFPRLLMIGAKELALIPADQGVLGWPNLFPLDVPLWFLFYDSLVYLLFLVALRRLPLKWLIVVAAVSVSGLWWTAINNNTVSFGTLWADCASSILRSLGDFTIGYILFRLYKPGHFSIGPRLGFLPIIALLVVVLLPIPANWRFSGILEAFVATVIMPIIIFFGAYSHAGFRLQRAARVSGRLALPVYVLHYPLIRTLSALRWDFHLRGIAGLALLAVEFLLPILLAFLFTKYSEQPLPFSATRTHEGILDERHRIWGVRKTNGCLR
jgi:peptidoglycan/LPS O-acetylase OafA/YrhL